MFLSGPRPALDRPALAQPEQPAKPSGGPAAAPDPAVTFERLDLGIAQRAVAHAVRLQAWQSHDNIPGMKQRTDKPE